MEESPAYFTALSHGPDGQQKKPSIIKRISVVVIGLAVVASVVALSLSLSSSSNSSDDASGKRSMKPLDQVAFRVNGVWVAIGVEGTSAFRVSVSHGDVAPTAIPNQMLAPKQSQSYFIVTYASDSVTVKTDFGQIQVNNKTGAFEMRDASGRIVTITDNFLPTLPTASKTDSCQQVYPSTDVDFADRTPQCPYGLPGKTEDSCCSACNQDPDCTAWVYASPGHESEGKNCWLLKGSSISTHAAFDRTAGGPGIRTPTPQFTVSFGRSANSKFYGPGGGADTVGTLSKKQARSMVTNTAFYMPHYYTSDGYSALAVSNLEFDPELIYGYPVSWSLTDAKAVWTVKGQQVDFYLTPASSQAVALDLFWDLTGRPVIPPRYAFGFMACRWGWKDHAYITDMLTQFRQGNYSIDAWISDFEWYTPNPDYNLPETGSKDFQDFGYNSITFPNPVDNLREYHNTFKMRFGGIRKPRLGNSDLLVMAKSKGWTVNADHGGGAPGGTRNLNYSKSDVRQWYSDNQAHFLTDGVDFYWNDEGETYFFAFYDWNLAQWEGQNKWNSSKRFFSINRSYNPGMQRLGASVWTGDIQVTWDAMRQQPGYMLNWALAGTPYVTCDTGGFNGGDSPPLLLSRWYQVAAFMPIMRVHSSLDNTPHFPFLYPADAAGAMKEALGIRYQFVPYHYSLAHVAYKSGGKPIFRPMLMEFPSDPAVAEMTQQWMDGDGLLVCPVMNTDNSTNCYLPQGLWYDFNPTTVVGVVPRSGPATVDLRNVPLHTIPLFAAAGTILTLAPVLQYTDQLPGGALSVIVFGGASGTFTLVEDDGETLGYQNGNVRTTVFTWNDMIRTLSWQVQGTHADSHVFVQLVAIGYFPDGSTKRTGYYTLGSGGQLTF